MSKPRAPRRVREPVQVYLDEADRALLVEVARRTGLSRAEILRRGLRVVAADLLSEQRPGSSLDYLIGLLPDAPADVGARHDEYLARGLQEELDRPR